MAFRAVGASAKPRVQPRFKPRLPAKRLLTAGTKHRRTTAASSNHRQRLARMAANRANASSPIPTLVTGPTTSAASAASPPSPKSVVLVSRTPSATPKSASTFHTIKSPHPHASNALRRLYRLLLQQHEAVATAAVKLRSFSLRDIVTALNTHSVAFFEELVDSNTAILKHASSVTLGKSVSLALPSSPSATVVPPRDDLLEKINRQEVLVGQMSTTLPLPDPAMLWRALLAPEPQGTRFLYDVFVKRQDQLRQKFLQRRVFVATVHAQLTSKIFLRQHLPLKFVASHALLSSEIGALRQALITHQDALPPLKFEATSLVVAAFKTHWIACLTTNHLPRDDKDLIEALMSAIGTIDAELVRLTGHTSAHREWTVVVLHDLVARVLECLRVTEKAYKLMWWEDQGPARVQMPRHATQRILGHPIRQLHKALHCSRPSMLALLNSESAACNSSAGVISEHTEPCTSCACYFFVPHIEVWHTFYASRCESPLLSLLLFSK